MGAMDFSAVLCLDPRIGILDADCPQREREREIFSGLKDLADGTSTTNWLRGGRSTDVLTLRKGYGVIRYSIAAQSGQSPISLEHMRTTDIRYDSSKFI
jgi:hypothetical protein